ncbi:hypothetical protein [Azospira sp. I09]|jgi:hypothetical protein|uniref:hypothetical protein n=1 Tax=Azospira sp. I09 TaxID=1765049 RepID=UPI0012610470|nr:hypothetical protein [Azospira sp. I09]BBN88832.1 hypothetical protein AZSP09_18550 [Azospira sp. I09]
MSNLLVVRDWTLKSGATQFRGDVGRTILFAYTSKVGPNGGLIGNVKCFLKQQHPFLQFVDLGGFTYTGAGETNLKAPDDDDFIVIDVDIAALYVALNFIHKALAK